MEKVAIGQAGGPTAVINASLVGFLDQLTDQDEAYVIFNGFQGLVDDQIYPMTDPLSQQINSYHDVPGCCLGAGRYPIDNSNIEKVVEHLRQRDIHSLVFIGGNGTMSTLLDIQRSAQHMHYDLQVIGIPKTVDNDLYLTDHAPGFASAARYIALSTRDISKDLEAMKNFEQVRILETMGRNVGWLAASSGLFKEHDTDGPHLIYLPENHLNHESFLQEIQHTVQSLGFATVVVSEGVQLEDHEKVMLESVNGRNILGGVSQHLSYLVKKELGYVTRSEILGMNQRSAQLYVSAQDRLEAYQVGAKAFEYIQQGESEIMVAIQRQSGDTYLFELSHVALREVALKERTLFPEFIEDRQAFYKWLKPLIGADVEPYPPMLHREVKLI